MAGGLVGMGHRRTVAGYEKAAPADRGGQLTFGRKTSSERATTCWCRGARKEPRRVPLLGTEARE